MEELEKEKHKLVLDNQILKNEKGSLDESLKDLVKKNKDLITKNKNLTEDIKKSKSLIDRFTLSSTRLDMMLKSQRAIFDKTGVLGSSDVCREGGRSRQVVEDVVRVDDQLGAWLLPKVVLSTCKKVRHRL